MDLPVSIGHGRWGIVHFRLTNELIAVVDVVTAVKACLPRPTSEGQPPTNLQVLPCLDYSLSPDQLMKLDKPQSVFGNEEVCQ